MKKQATNKPPARAYVNVPLKAEVKAALSEQAIENGRSSGMEASFIIERAIGKRLKAAKEAK